MAQRYPSLTALGRRPVPDRIDWDGRSFTLRRIFKNDFFAVTSLYECSTTRIVLKIGRQTPFLGIPGRVIGRFLARREAAALTALSDVAGIPALLGRWEDTGTVREYIDGRPLRKGEPVPDDFHDRLGNLIAEVHARGMAYIDLEKCENVILADDGTPYLIDFQIAWLWPAERGGDLAPLRWLRKRLQAADRYHLLKLKRRTRPDLLTPAERDASYRRPWYVRLHTAWTRPLTLLRRAVLSALGHRKGDRERGTVTHDRA